MESQAGAGRIGVLQGASSEVIQGLMRDFVESRRETWRIAGVVGEEVPDGAGGGRPGLRNVVDGTRYAIFQDLGPGAASCGLDPGGVTAACEAVRRDIARGCDLVVLSKFAQLEADRAGLGGAFAAAMEADVPILTAVSPKFADAWDRFAAPLYQILPPDVSALEAWWRAVAEPPPT